MPEAAQTFANHGRYRPLFHFTTLPILLINAIVWIVAFVKEPGLMSGWMAIVWLFVFLFVFDNRVAYLQIQDRVIRDEMKLRLERVLGAGAREKIVKLSVGQMIGLRFACDAELPGLVDRAIAGELANRKLVKQAIQKWEPDHLRA